MKINNVLNKILNKDKYSKGRNENFPLRNLIASRGEIEAISRGTAPEIYTHVYGTHNIPTQHKRDAKEILQDKYGKDNKPVTYRQAWQAAHQGSWKCHGYTLEPDAKCPTCGRSVL